MMRRRRGGGEEEHSDGVGREDERGARERSCSNIVAWLDPSLLLPRPLRRLRKERLMVLAARATWTPPLRISTN